MPTFNFGFRVCAGVKCGAAAVLIMIGALVFAGCGSPVHPGPDFTPVNLVSVRITPAAVELALGQSLQLLASGVYSDGTVKDETATVQWSSTDASILTVSAGGIAKANAMGTTTISAAIGTAVASASVKVTAAIPIKISVSPNTLSLPAGKGQQFTASATLSDGTVQDLTKQVSWSTSDRAIASIDANGQLTALTAGGTVVTASLNTLSASSQLNVTQPVLISLFLKGDKAPLQTVALALGQSLQLSAVGTYSDGTSKDETTAVQWSSGNPSILAVTAAGLAKAETMGTTNVFAAIGSVVASASVKVGVAVPVGISVLPNPYSLPAGEKVQFSASATLSDGTVQDVTRLVSWTTSDSSIAAIDVNGLVTTLKLGSSSITASQGKLSASSHLTVTQAELYTLSLKADTATLPAGAAEQITALGVFSDGTTQDLSGSASWSSSSLTVLSIDRSGVVTGMMGGRSMVRAWIGDISANLIITVSAPQLTGIIVVAPDTVIPLDSTEQVSAWAIYGDHSMRDITAEARWSVSDAQILTMSSGGSITAVAAGTAIITASFQQFSGSTQITAAPLSSLEIKPASISLLAGSSVTLQAIGAFADGTYSDVTAAVIWTAADPSILEIGKEGTAQGISAGSTSVTAQLNGIIMTAPAIVRPVALTTYFSNANGGPDSTLRITPGNTGNAESCTLIYVFNQDQQMAECCGCTGSTNSLRTLAVSRDLLSNPLTKVSPDAGSIILITGGQQDKSQCDASAIGSVKAGTAWSTSMQKFGTDSYATETNVSPTEISDAFLTSVQAQCRYVQQLGSGRGICSCGTGE